MNLLLLISLTLIAVIITINIVNIVWSIGTKKDKSVSASKAGNISDTSYKTTIMSSYYFTESTLFADHNELDHLRKHSSKINPEKHGDAMSEHLTQHQQAVLELIGNNTSNANDAVTAALPKKEYFNTPEKELLAVTESPLTSHQSSINHFKMHDRAINLKNHGTEMSENLKQHQKAAMEVIAKKIPYNNDIDETDQLPIEDHFDAHEKELQTVTQQRAVSPIKF